MITASGNAAALPGHAATANAPASLRPATDTDTICDRLIRTIDSANRPNETNQKHTTHKESSVNMINTIILSGRVTKAVRNNQVNGSPVVNFVAAFETGYRPKLATVDGKEMLVQVAETTYMDCAAWNDEAYRAASLEIGQEVTVQVTSMFPKPREYQNELYADIQARVINVRPGEKSKAKALGNGAPAAANEARQNAPQDNEVPF
jgi:hypothetical protein